MSRMIDPAEFDPIVFGRASFDQERTRSHPTGPAAPRLGYV
jgi:hypothetical protein